MRVLTPSQALIPQTITKQSGKNYTRLDICRFREAQDPSGMICLVCACTLDVHSDICADKILVHAPVWCNVDKFRTSKVPQAQLFPTGEEK